MKKILAIVLVLAMVLVPVSALAAPTASLARTITVDNDATKGTVKIASGTTVVTSYNSRDTYTVTVTSKEGWLVDDANCTGASFSGGVATIAAGTAAVALKIAYVADDPTVAAAVSKDGAATGVTTLFGKVIIDKPYARTGKITLTADIKDALFVGWYDATGEITTGAAGTKLTIDAATYYAETDPVIYAKINTAVGSITALVDEANPYGTVSVVWTSTTAATVTAKPNAGAKFWAWKNIEGVTLTEGQLTNPVIKLVDIGRDDEVIMTAQFIKGSGNISSDDATAGKSDNPKTGDSSNLALWSIMGIIALGGVALAAKKVFAK